MFRRGSHCVIASAEEDKSIAMSNMVSTGLENLPLWMKPEITKESAKSGWEFGSNESDILIEHGAQTKGISRGSTPIAAHLSEIAYYSNPYETIESSLLRAMHENKRTFLVSNRPPRKRTIGCTIHGKKTAMESWITPTNSPSVSSPGILGGTNTPPLTGCGIIRSLMIGNR